MRHIICLGLLSTIIIGGAQRAHAQAASPQPFMPLPPAAAHNSVQLPRVKLAPPAAFSSEEDRDAYLENFDSDYQSARALRGWGIAMMIIGGTALSVTGAYLAVSHMFCGLDFGDGGYGGSSDACDITPAQGIALAASGVTLIAGIIMTVSGHKQLNRIRQRFQVGVAPTRGGAAASVALRF